LALVPGAKVKVPEMATTSQVKGTWELVQESKAQEQVRAEPATETKGKAQGIWVQAQDI
jgi:hypothetical protein